MNDHLPPAQPALRPPSMPGASKPTRGDAFRHFFLHAVHVAAIGFLCVFQLFAPPFLPALRLASVCLVSTLAYALSAAALGPHISRRPALAHLVVGGTFLFSSLLAGIFFVWQDWAGYGHVPAKPLWRTLAAAGNGLTYGGILALLYFPLTWVAYSAALTGTRRLAKRIFSREPMTNKAASPQENRP